MTESATKYHDISIGHRVVGHEGKCQFLHGHNLRIHFTCAAPTLDKVGRVVDFGVIGSHLCSWIEDFWDHKFLMWEDDPMLLLFDIMWKARTNPTSPYLFKMRESIIRTEFNPTSENIASNLLRIVGPNRLTGVPVLLTEVTVWETRKCYAVSKLSNDEVASAFQKMGV